MRSRSAESSIILRIPRATCQAVRGMTSAVSPAIAKSVVPLAVQTTGMPHAIASIVGFDHPAFLSADTKRCADP
jgi:hypothetical protein